MLYNYLAANSKLLFYRIWLFCRELVDALLCTSLADKYLAILLGYNIAIETLQNESGV